MVMAMSRHVPGQNAVRWAGERMVRAHKMRKQTQTKRDRLAEHYNDMAVVYYGDGTTNAKSTRKSFNS